MARHRHSRQRRVLLKGMAGIAASVAIAPGFSLAAGAKQYRVVPRSNERIPAVGMGTWITFNTPPLTQARRDRVEVLRAFFENGGTLVDSSPMYGFAESTLGYCLEELGDDSPLFAATKVWTPTRLAGIAQMSASRSLWGTDGFDLMQVHNMVDWQTHLPTLLQMQEDGEIRYIGITTSHGRRHGRMLEVIENRPEFDFVQFTYNIADREAEEKLLPAAARHGKAVIINRPFRGGELFTRTRDKELPAWADEIDCYNWAQFFLKFVVSHPAVTCAIPATSSVAHMTENMGALYGAMPDQQMRLRMQDHFDRL